MAMNIYIKIFTEGGEKIGFGHISRCTALYDEATRQGITVELFIWNNGFGDNENSLLESRKVTFVNWQDPDYLLKNMNKNDFCIVDSYLAPIEIYELIARLARKAVYLDDYGRLDYPEGIVVNPSLSTEGIKYKQKKNCEYLLGGQYIILRTPFLGKEKRCLNKGIEQVLITLGGADPLNLTARITSLLSEKYPELIFNVILGSLFQLTEQFGQFKNVRIYNNLSAQEMCDLMTRTDFAITAAGQTIYELIFLKIPFVVIQTAKNQENNVDALKGAMLKQWIIDYKDKNALKIIDESFQKILSPSKCTNFVNTMDQYIDGFGCERIIERLIDTKITFILREVSMRDCELLYHWVNEKGVRENAFNSKYVSYDDHFLWMEKKLKDSRVKMYIAYFDKKAVGQIRIEFDVSGDGEIDYSIDPKYRGKGYGSMLLLMIADKLKKEKYLSYKRLVGKVKFENTPSKKAFLNAKFSEIRMEDYYCYIYELKDGESE